MTGRHVIALGLAVAVAAALLAGVDDYGLRLLTLAAIYAIAVLGYQLALGHAGVLSLAQGAFFGVGAYVSGILTTTHGWDGAPALAAGALTAAGLAAFVAVPVLRLETHYFALATLAIAEVVHLLAVNWTEMTGGANGIYGVPPLTLFGFVVAPGWPLLIAVSGVLAAMIALATWRVGGRRRLVLALARTAPLAADCLGIARRALRFELFVLGAGMGGLAGALQGHTVGVVSPAVTDFALMVSFLVAALIGGRDRIVGAVIGALLVVHLPEWLRLFDVYYLAIYGVALLAVIILAPAGLAGLLPAAGTRPPNDPASTPRRWQGGSLDAQDLRKRFGGVVAVDGVDIALPTGRITGIIGPNGSGKTTLLNLITGLVAADDGSVTIDRARLDPMAADQRARAGLARGFQHPEFDGEQNVWAAVMAAQPLNRSMARARAQGAAALAAMDLGGWSRAINDLTPAECRRLDIARALTNRPRVLLLDEPAAGLTDGEQTALAHDLRRLADGGLTVAVVEHGMRFLLPLADRVICLDRGRVIAVGTPAEVVAAPAVIDSYLGREAGAAATNLLGGA